MKASALILCIGGTSLLSTTLTVVAMSIITRPTAAPVAPAPIMAPVAVAPVAPAPQPVVHEVQPQIEPAPAPAPVAAVAPPVAAPDAPPPEPTIVYRDSPPVVIHEREVIHDQPVIVEQQAPQTIVVHDVVYRDVYTGYLGCTEEEVALVPQYRTTYHLCDEDILVVRFVARCAGLPFSLAIRDFCGPCRGSTQLLIARYGVSPAVFFVELPAGACIGLYERPYWWYRQGRCHEAVLSNAEFQALFALKVSCDYNHCPAPVFLAAPQAVTAPMATMQVFAKQSPPHAQGPENLGPNHRPVPGVVASQPASVESHPLAPVRRDAIAPQALVAEPADQVEASTKTVDEPRAPTRPVVVAPPSEQPDRAPIHLPSRPPVVVAPPVEPREPVARPTGLDDRAPERDQPSTREGAHAFAPPVRDTPVVREAPVREAPASAPITRTSPVLAPRPLPAPAHRKGAPDDKDTEN